MPIAFCRIGTYKNCFTNYNYEKYMRQIKRLTGSWHLLFCFMSAETPKETSAEEFKKTIEASYNQKENVALLGCAMLEQKPLQHLCVQAPLSMLNRHGLINGATGTGKTRTIQVLAEQLSANQIPVFLMDMKGDLSGMAMPGTPHPKIDERLSACGKTFTPQSFPTEFFTLDNSGGIQLKATVSEMGAKLLGRILDLSSAQQGLLEVIIKFCDDQNLLLIDTQDLKKVLLYLDEEGKEEFESEYGKLSSASAGTILRKLMALEEKGGKNFLGEVSFDTQHLLRVQDDKGVISILRLQELLMQPEVYTTFLLQLLSEIMTTFPEQGDAEKPRLVLFIDEAHLIFRDIAPDLLKQIDLVVRLIRSKGVGIIFCTQNMNDIPSSILSQLGLRISHGLRAVTAADRKRIKLTAENFPTSDFYVMDELVTSLGTGEALITLLDKKGKPTQSVHTLMTAPLSRMGTLSQEELDSLLQRSEISQHYKEVDPESAYELLQKRLEQKSRNNEKEIAETKKAASKKLKKENTEREKYIEEEHAEKEENTEALKTSRKRKKKEKSFVEDVLESKLVLQMGRSAARKISGEVTRGIMGALLGLFK